MNRRDLLMRLAAVPFIGAVARAAIARDFSTATMTAKVTYSDGIALTSCAHPESSMPLAEADFAPGTFEIIVLDMPAHDFGPARDICRHCGATQIQVEDGVAPIYCTGLPGGWVRK